MWGLWIGTLREFEYGSEDFSQVVRTFPEYLSQASSLLSSHTVERSYYLC